MKDFINSATDWIYRATASAKFFAITLLLLAFQSVWLAFTAIYPMPFDEYAHIGAIQLYARQWSPFITQQPLDSGVIGDLTREPSVLYRWLMSYPYRWLEVVFDNPQSIIISMRLMNIAMVVGGVILFRKLLLEWGLSRRLTHVVLLVFVMTPIVPFLAAHVNYDNFMFLMAPLVFLYATRLVRGNDNLVRNLALFLLAGGAATMAKQTFLPLMAVITAYVVYSLWSRNRSKLPREIKKSWRRTPKNISALLVALGLVGIGILAVERYGINIVRYGSVRPRCQVVQPVELCYDFGPWYRDNVVNRQNRPAEPPYGNPVSFSQFWVSKIMRGYFVPFSHTPTQVVWDREPFGPIVVKPILPVGFVFACIAATLGVIAVLWQRRKIWDNRMLRFALVVSVGFVAVQWAYNYNSYLRLWKAEAVQARYTYPIMILISTLIAYAVVQIAKSRQARAGLVVMLVLFYAWGGGIAPWLIRADDTWRWQNSTTQSVNRKIQTILRYTVVH